jgi:hypothetical protein
MTRFGLLLSLLAIGPLGLVACDDGETAATEAETITSSAARSRVETESCGNFRGRGPGGYPVRIEVLEGKVPCREAQHVLKTYYNGRDHAPWACRGFGDRLVECEKTRGVGAIAGHFYCRTWGSDQADCLSRFGPP